VQELEGQVQGMHLPDNVEKAWKDVEHDLSENPLSKGVDSLQKLTDPSVRAVCCQCDCLFATTCKVCPPDAKDDTTVGHLWQSWITDYLKGNLPQVGSSSSPFYGCLRCNFCCFMNGVQHCSFHSLSCAGGYASILFVCSLP
jgi:hypothetical protein